MDYWSKHRWGLIKKGKVDGVLEDTWEKAENEEEERKRNRIWRRAGRSVNSAVLRLYVALSGAGRDRG